MATRCSIGEACYQQGSKWEYAPVELIRRKSELRVPKDYSEQTERTLRGPDSLRVFTRKGVVPTETTKATEGDAPRGNQEKGASWVSCGIRHLGGIALLKNHKL